MFDKNQRYESIPSEEDMILGYKRPISIGRYEKGSIYYQDYLNQETRITFEHLPEFLTALLEEGVKSHSFLMIFQKNGKTMEGQENFETDLEKSPAIMDYWLLRLVDITQRSGVEKIYLEELYKNLTKELNTYKLAIQYLNKNASKRQNKSREETIETFEKNWNDLIETAIQKYEAQWDIRNILLNITAAATIVGLLWLGAKNISHFAQGKKLGLFQFEQAHSKKIEHLKELNINMDIDGAKLSNYFTEDITDSKATHQELEAIVKELEKQIKLLPRDQRGFVPKLVSDFNGDLERYKEGLDGLEDLSLKNSEDCRFIEEWITSAKVLEINNISQYPKNISSQLQILQTITEELKIEKEQLEHNVFTPKTL